MTKNKYHKYTEEERVFIKQNVKGRTNLELAELMKKEFDLEISARQMKSYKNNNNFTSGLNTKFKKGRIPFNKGKKFPGQVNAGSYKKGNRSGNALKRYKPIGFERFTKDEYIQIKVNDDFPSQNRWKLKHRLVYEKIYGKLKKDEMLLFLDGNKKNVALDNLMKVTRREIATLNKLKLLDSNNSEAKKAAVLSIRLQNLVADKKGEK